MGVKALVINQYKGLYTQNPIIYSMSVITEKKAEYAAKFLVEICTTSEICYNIITHTILVGT